MAAPNFELITELQILTRRDFPVKDPAYLKPLDSSAIIDGEWLLLNADYKLERPATDVQSMSVYPVHTERGRYDTQAIGKANVLMLGQFEAKTKVVEPGLTYNPGDQLKVCTISTGTFAGKRGLSNAAAVVGDVIVGYVTKGLVNGELRFVRTPPVKVTGVGTVV